MCIRDRIKSASNPAVFSQLAANPNDISVVGLAQNEGFIMMLFPFISGLIAFIILIKPLNNRTLKMTINGGGKIRWNKFFISATVWTILLALYLIFYLKLDPENFTVNNLSLIHI